MVYPKLKIYTDGGARGNPGPAACAAVLKDPSGRIVSRQSQYLNRTTNNQAEYRGVLLGLNLAKKFGAQEIDFYLDSQLVVNQLNLEYKVKDLALQSVFVKIWNLGLGFKKIRFHHIPREENKEADQLVNQELDAQ